MNHFPFKISKKIVKNNNDQLHDQISARLVRIDHFPLQTHPENFLKNNND